MASCPGEGGVRTHRVGREGSACTPRAEPTDASLCSPRVSRPGPALSSGARRALDGLLMKAQTLLSAAPGSQAGTSGRGVHMCSVGDVLLP